MHTNLFCACWHLEAMKGSSSLTSCRILILSRLLSSLVWAQLTLLVPALGIRSPLPQDGAPIHRVRAHSLTGIRNNQRYFKENHSLKLHRHYFSKEIHHLTLHYRYYLLFIVTLPTSGYSTLWTTA
jgi:hypothetical protein